jgi:hypothetical protein
MYAPGDLMVVMSDTGDEHPGTYAYVAFIQELCKQHDIFFVLIGPNMGYHPNTWHSLREWMETHGGIMSKAFPKSCTDNLKIKPIYNFLNDFLGWLIKMPESERARKNGIKEFVRQNGKIHILIGIAKGEESRIGDKMPNKWMNQCLYRSYPLVHLGMDRQACQELITEYGFLVPPPSNCMLCPFMSNIELLWLYNNYPADYHYWVERERIKIARFPDLPKNKNLGVNGVKLLPQVLAEAQIKYAHMSEDEINEYKMSHGHCVQSKY